jgi:hypothetical protein
MTALKIDLYWGLTIQVTALLFLAARRYESSEDKLRATHAICRKVGGRSLKAYALWPYRCKLFSAALDMLTIEAAVSLLIMFEASNDGFYDKRFLIESFLILSTMAIPIYCIGLVPYWYYSRKGAYKQA